MGISDIIDMLTPIFKSRNINLIVVDQLQAGETNILIEDFSSNDVIESIRQFKSKQPYSKIICVITEFPNCFFGDFTFNAPNKFPYNLFLLFDITIYKSKNLFKLFFKIIFAIICIPFIPINFFLMSPHVMNKFISESSVTNVNKNYGRVNSTVRVFSKLTYFISVFFRKTKSFFFLLLNPPRRSYHLLKYQRFHNFIKVSDSFDNIVSMHPASNVNHIWNTFNLSIDNYFTPEISAHDFHNSLHKPSRDIVFSGNLTPFRRQTIRAINTKFTNSGYSIKSFNYSAEVSKNLFAFTICIKQFKDWKYSSPGRVWRAYSLENSIPLLVEKFNDHPIENICIFNFIQLNLNKICLDNIVNSYKQYSAFAKKNNDNVIRSLP